MLSTILSENQYDTKFVPAANRNPRTSPCEPPRSSPTNRKRALRKPSNSAVFTVLCICAHPRALMVPRSPPVTPRRTPIRPKKRSGDPSSSYKSGENLQSCNQTSNQSRPIGECFHEHVLV